MAEARSHTGRALREYEAALGVVPLAPVARAPAAGNPLQLALRERARRNILVHNAREHNLQNIDVALPRDRFTVITGVSGSGKSTLAFDIVFAEGQRRYLESLNAYARQFVQPASRPDVDAIFGIPPTVAIEQRTSRGGRKSTVATLTEVYHFLRLLYMKLGTQFCPDCNVPIEPQSADAIAAQILNDFRGRRIGLLAPLVVNRKGYYTDLAKWARGKGYTHLRVDGEFLPTAKWPRLDRFKEHTIELPVADLAVAPDRERELREALARALEFGKGVVHVLEGLDRLEAAAAGRAGIASSSTSRSRCSRPSAPARRAAAASRSSTRASSRSTRSTAGATPATAPGSSSRGSTRSRPARKSGGTRGGRATPSPAPRARGSASTRWRSTCASATGRSPT